MSRSQNCPNPAAIVVSQLKRCSSVRSVDSSEEEEGKQGLRRSSRQKRGREVLNYGRLGSPGYVNMSSMVLQLVRQQHALLSVVCAVLGEGSVPVEETRQPSGDGSNILHPGGEHP